MTNKNKMAARFEEAKESIQRQLDTNRKMLNPRVVETVQASIDALEIARRIAEKSENGYQNFTGEEFHHVGQCKQLLKEVCGDE